MSYKYNQRPNTVIDESVIATFENRKYVVLIGKNNCGKSYILKELSVRSGGNGRYLGPARFGSIFILGNSNPADNRKQNEFNSLQHQFTQQKENQENQGHDLSGEITELSDVQRSHLIEIIKLLLNIEIEFKHTVDGNSMSQRYISANNHNISFTSSGFRMIMSIISGLLNSNYEKFYVDEPELGISPEAQTSLFLLLNNVIYRDKYFPHIKSIILATHSTLFLDKTEFSNNYIIKKSDDLISVCQVRSIQEMHDAHFFLMGNRLDQLYLPSAIIFVEGKTDHKFIGKVISIMMKNLTVSVICVDGDGKMKEQVNNLKNFLGDIQKSPYKSRIFCILDEIHEKTLPKQLESMGIVQENIVVWSKNGIEYYYPESIISKIFGSSQITMSDDMIGANGISLKKDQLVEKIIEKLSAESVYSDEFMGKFLSKVIAFL